MGEFYYALVAQPSSHIELFRDFLADTLPVGFEELDDSFIIRSEDELDTISWGIDQFAEALSKALNTTVSVNLTLSKEKNEDWIKLYQEGISSIKVGDFFIHPTWDEPSKDKLNIEIDPSLAFGTGHHPTTASCIKAISTYVKPEQKVFDVGCGSGILAIAASKKGAIVDLCDTDEVSIENSKQNIKLNDVKINDIFIGSANNTEKTYDVVIANIVADVLTMIKKDLKARLNDGGILILSGILDKYENKVLKAFSDLELIENIKDKEWITLVVKKVENGQ